MTGVALLALGLVGCSDEGSPPKEVTGSERIEGPIQNVLLVVVDTLRADHLGCYGYPRDTSPRIDALAAEGTRFDRAFTAWPETAPSMAAILAGSHSQSNGVMRRTPNMVPAVLETLPELLGQAGARTAAMVANAVLDRRYQFDQGIDDYFQEWDDGRWKTSEDACEWLEDYGQDGPWFLWAHFMEPHAPYQPAASYAGRFEGDGKQDPDVRAVVNDGQWDAFGGFPGFSKLDGVETLDGYRSRYDSEILWADARVGEVLDSLERLGLLETTLVIFTADHGEGFGEHDYYWHGQTPYNEGARVPLIVRMPGAPAGRVVHEPVSTIDIAPTALDAVGLTSPRTHQGHSLVPRVMGEDVPLVRDVFTESGGVEHYQQSIVRGPWKLVDVRSEAERAKLTGARFELYHLDQDAGETTNLVDEQPEMFTELRTALEKWRDTVDIFAQPEDVPKLTGDDAERIKNIGYMTDGPSADDSEDE